MSRTNTNQGYPPTGVETGFVQWRFHDDVVATTRVTWKLITKPPSRKTTPPNSASPYTVRNLDAAIAHLERVLEDENALAIFGAAYWRSRIREVEATVGVMHSQLHRLRALLKRLDDAPGLAAANAPFFRSRAADRTADCLEP